MKKSQVKIRVAILQRVCAPYRLAYFKKLSLSEDLDVKFFIGEDLPNSKVKNHPKIEGINYIKLETNFIGKGKRVFPWHKSLVKELTSYAPDVILCEAESHFFGYLKAIYYKYFCSNNVGLIYWCFIGLPGVEDSKYQLTNIIKSVTRRFFDAFLLYSHYSKRRLVKLGFDESKIFVSTNVGNVEEYIAEDKKISLSKSEARQKLGLPEKFTVLYVGTLDANKRPEVMLDLAQIKDCNFVLLGSGSMFEDLRSRCQQETLKNVFLPGRVSADLRIYYRAADVLLIPGRGGIVISEAMSFGLPVIVHEADGTENDLVIDRKTGLHLSEGSLINFSEAIDYIKINPEEYKKMSDECRKLVSTQFNSANMIKQTTKAVEYVYSHKKQKNI